MLQLPGAVLLCGCFVLAAAGATALWSLAQAALDLVPAARRRGVRARASAGAHLRRATGAATLALLVAGLPALLRHLATLGLLLGLP